MDIIAFSKSLKIAWIVKYISDDCKSKWKNFEDFFLSKWGGKLVFLGNLEKKTLRNMISRRTSSENLSTSRWTLILETLSSPNTTFVVVV